MKEFDKLLEIVEHLRSPQGCPWDREQKVADYTRYLLEEAYELIEGIHNHDVGVIKEELGDVFLILVMIAQILSEDGHFKVADVLETITAKLISRHPHVFSSKKLTTAQDVLNHWINDKARRKMRKTVKDRLPLHAPALLIAALLFKEQAGLGRGAPQDKEKQSQASIAEITQGLKSFPGARDKGRLLAEIVFRVSEISYLYDIDLENLLKDKVFREAEKQAY